MQDLIKSDSTSNGRWTRDEHESFLEGLRIYGKNWKQIQQLVLTRSGSQIRSHAQKFFLKLKQGGKKELTEHTQNSGDFQDNADEPIQNSKMVSETRSQQQDYSYFLMKIVEYHNSENCFDFWTDLVDCNRKISRITKTENYNSFIMIGDGSDQCGLYNIELK